MVIKVPRRIVSDSVIICIIKINRQKHKLYKFVVAVLSGEFSDFVGIWGIQMFALRANKRKGPSSEKDIS